MINKDMLAKKYKDFVSEDKQKFIEQLNFIKSKINVEALQNRPLLIYSQNKRNALYYVLAIYYSLKNEKLLNYEVVTGQTLINQHFATSTDKDHELHERVYYTDLTFINLSQYDYSSEYLESQIIDLVEFRNRQKKLTIISYDVMNSGQNYINLTKKLHAYFVSNEYQIADLTSGKASKATPFDRQTNSPDVIPAKTTKKKRII
jgi:hypothetical protein